MEDNSAYRTNAKPKPEKMYYMETHIWFVGSNEPLKYRFEAKPKPVIMERLSEERAAWTNSIAHGITLTRAGSIINCKNVTRVEVFPVEDRLGDEYP